MANRGSWKADRDRSNLGGSVALGAASALRRSDEPTLDQLLAEPIVQQLMRRDRTDEATIRRLLSEAPAARATSREKHDPNADDRHAIVRLLRDIARLCRSRWDRELSTQIPGLTRARCTVLICLAQHEGVSQSALARILDISSMSLVRLLDRLEAAGCVMRRPDPDDRRTHVLTLTPKALPIIDCIRDLNSKAYDALRLGISNAEASHLRALLVRIRSNLTAE
jgi:MarR family transcriptional regulator, transcriptional regulator for hemolysin